MNSFIELKKLEYLKPFSGLKAKLVHTNIQTIAFWEIKKDSLLPEHDHPHQQISIVTKGELELTIDGVSKCMKPGMVAIIPSNTSHSAKALTNVEMIDVFYPVREDLKQN